MAVFRLIVVVLVTLLSVILFKLKDNEQVATVGYIIASKLLSFDHDQHFIENHDGEIEDGIFTHRFIHVTKTFKGKYVNATYHIVECGKNYAEPIVFGHGLAENWRVWKASMAEFCKTHRAIAIDSEGMGQSRWANVKDEIPVGKSHSFMADMQMQLLSQIGVRCFNLVITDYSFWSTLRMLTEFGNNTIIRYGKLQSTVGVEDPDRIPQAIILKRLPDFFKIVFNLNTKALARILFGKSLIQWEAVHKNRRNGREIDDKEFKDNILTGLSEGCYTPWVYFYHYGGDMIEQMTYQIKAFADATFPVYMIQGKEDKGQPYELLDGTARMDFVEAPVTSFAERIKRFNHQIKVVTTYSRNGTKIGPTAEEFFPNSPWKKMTLMDGVGHFPHIEAQDEVVTMLKELFSVPVTNNRNSDNQWCGEYFQEIPQHKQQVIYKEQFTEESMAQFRKAFNEFDLNRDGTITQSELMEMMKLRDSSVTIDHIREMVVMFDTNQDGEISFDEFLQAMLHNLKEEQEVDDDLIETFVTFDLNGDGYIEYEELSKVLTEMGELKTPDEVLLMIRSADLDRDNQVSFDEFRRTMAASNYQQQQEMMNQQ